MTTLSRIFIVSNTNTDNTINTATIDSMIADALAKHAAQRDAATAARAAQSTGTADVADTTGALQAALDKRKAEMAATTTFDAASNTVKSLAAATGEICTQTGNAAVATAVIGGSLLGAVAAGANRVIPLASKAVDVLEDVLDAGVEYSGELTKHAKKLGATRDARAASAVAKTLNKVAAEYDQMAEDATDLHIKAVYMVKAKAIRLDAITRVTPNISNDEVKEVEAKLTAEAETDAETYDVAKELADTKAKLYIAEEQAKSANSLYEKALQTIAEIEAEDDDADAGNDDADAEDESFRI